MTNKILPPSGTGKKAEATLETMRKVFTLPESEDSTLMRLDLEIARNLHGFLREHIVAGDIEPVDLERDFEDTKIPDEPAWVKDQVEHLLTKVVAQSVHTSSPRFVGHMTSALPYFMIPLTKIMVALNQNVVKIETSKAFTPLERQVLGMLHRLVYGLDDEFYQRWTQDFRCSLGVFCSGGTIANVTALWVARNLLLHARGDYQGVAEDGLFRGMQAHGYSDLAVLVSRRGHYSLRKATDVLGLGRHNLVPVAINSQHKIDLIDLEAQIKKLRQQRVGILAVVGVAGATETGSVDPLDGIAALCQEHKIHFHVDAAWGGPTLFSDRYRPLLKGIELADSVTIDAHKQLYVPMGAGMCVFKNVEALGAIEHSAQYIIRKGSRDIGKHTLEGSRPGMCMLVHSALRIIGRRGYELLIDLGIGKAGQFAKMIKASSDFEIITEPELNLLTYRWLPEIARPLLAAEDASLRTAANELMSELTESIQKRQRAAGKSFVSRTRLEGQAYASQMLTVFRVVLANPLTTRQILAEILEEQRQHGKLIMIEDGLAQRFLDLTKQAGPLVAKESVP